MDRWRTTASEIERFNQTVTINDTAKFVERQENILGDPVFGNIHPSPVSNNSVKQATLRSRTRQFWY